MVAHEYGSVPYPIYIYILWEVLTMWLPIARLSLLWFVCNSYLVSLLFPQFSFKVHLKIVMLSQTIGIGVDGLEHCLPMERKGLGKIFVIRRSSPIDQSHMGQTLDKKATSLIVRTNRAPKCLKFKSPPHKG